MEVVNWRRYQSKWKHLQDIEFPQVGPRTTVDLLIRVDQADLLYSLKDVKGRPGEPIARLTPLGWTSIVTLMGRQRESTPILPSS